MRPQVQIVAVVVNELERQHAASLSLTFFETQTCAACVLRGTRTNTASAGTCANLFGDATRSSHSSGSCPVRDAACASRTRVIRAGQRLQQPLLPAPWIACSSRAGIAGRHYGLPSPGRPRHVLFHEGGPSTDGLWVSCAFGSYSPVIIRDVGITSSCSQCDRSVQRFSRCRLFLRTVRTPAQLTAVPPLHKIQ